MISGPLPGPPPRFPRDLPGPPARPSHPSSQPPAAEPWAQPGSIFALLEEAKREKAAKGAAASVVPDPKPAGDRKHKGDRKERKERKEKKAKKVGLQAVQR